MRALCVTRALLKLDPTATLLRLVLTLLVLSISPAWAADNCTSIALIDSAQRLASDVSPIAVLDSQQVILPDTLPLQLRSERVRISYGIDVSRCANASAPALWLFRVGAPYRATVDGQPMSLLSAHMLRSSELLVGHLLPSQPGIYNGRMPSLFALPPGARRVTIELQTLPYMPTGVGLARIGPTNQLLPVHVDAVDDIVAHADAASGVVLVLGAMALLLWLQRRGDRSLLWLAVACASWGLRGVAYFGHTVYVEALAYEQFNPLNVLVTSAALAMSVSYLLGSPGIRDRRNLGVVTLLCVAAVLLAAISGHGALPARALCLLTSFVIGGGIFVRIWQARARQSRLQLAVLAGGLAILVASATHDILMVTGTLGPESPSYLFWGFIAMLVAFAGISGQYIVRTLNLAERSSEELALRVHHKTHELEQSYQALRANEFAAARTQERERMVREMHDGLGAQLMTALRGIERGALGKEQVVQSLHEGLDELRLLMDSTDNTQPLQTALANWRNRWDGRLAATGLTLQWTLGDALEDIELPGDTVLQIMRVLQEAGANIVKHAQATEVAVSAGVHSEPGGGCGLVLEITDDGIGLPTFESSRPGRGIRNMRQRARLIGATLELMPRPNGLQGTTVRLHLPLPLPSPLH